MMRRLVSVLGLTLIALSTFPAQAQSSANGGSGFYFEETLFPVYKHENDTNSSSPGSANPAAVDSGLGYDSRTTLGYVLPKGIFVGATYNMYSLTTKRAYTAIDSGKDESTKSNEFGPTVGWVGGNWRILFSYFTSGKKTLDQKYTDATGTATTDTTFTYSNPSGFQALFGYSYMVSSRFGIGPSVIYRSLTYSKQAKTNRLNPVEDYSDLTPDDKYTKSTLDAMISLVFRF